MDEGVKKGGGAGAFLPEQPEGQTGLRLQLTLPRTSILKDTS